MYFCGGHYRQPDRRGARTCSPGAARRVERFREAGRRLVAGRLAGGPGVHRDAFFDALADDFNTPQALAAAHDVGQRGQPPRRRRGRATCARCSACSASRTCSTPASRARRARASSPRRARRRAPRATSPPPTRSATRSRAAGWEVRDGPDGPSSCRWRERLTGRNARARPTAPPTGARRLRAQPGAGGAARPAQGAPGLGQPRRPGRRAVAAQHGCTVRLRGRGDRASAAAPTPTRGSAPRSPPYPYADAAELLARPDPFLIALDEVTDPQNLGRGVPDRRGGGRDRRGHPRAPLGRGHAGGVQGVGRCGRASAGRARAQPRRLPRRRQAGRLLELRRRGRRARRPIASPDYRGGVGSRARRGGQRAAPARGVPSCDDLVALPCAGGSTRSTSAPPPRC